MESVISKRPISVKEQILSPQCQATVSNRVQIRSLIQGREVCHFHHKKEAKAIATSPHSRTLKAQISLKTYRSNHPPTNRVVRTLTVHLSLRLLWLDPKLHPRSMHLSHLLRSRFGIKSKTEVRLLLMNKRLCPCQRECLPSCPKMRILRMVKLLWRVHRITSIQLQSKMEVRQ